MRCIGTALAGLMWMAQPALAQEPPLTYEWASQASPTELRTRVLGPLAPLYRDVSAPRKMYQGRFSINFASAPRSVTFGGICMSDVMSVELSPIVEQPYSRDNFGDVEVHLDFVRTSQTWLYLEDAPKTMPTGEVSSDGRPYVAFDKVRTNELCAEHSDGWTFTIARDDLIFKMGVDLLKSVEDLAANNPTAFAALLDDCIGYQCSLLPNWFLTGSTDQIVVVSEVDCEQIDGVHDVNGWCLKLTLSDEDRSFFFSLLGRLDETFQWRAFKFVTFLD